MSLIGSAAGSTLISAVAGTALTAGVGYLASQSAGDAAQSAGDAQSQAALAGIDEQRRQFNAVQKLLAPYVTAGNGSIQAQQNLLGLGPEGSQQKAIDALQNSPQFTSGVQQGENAIRQNASATGGLRGGNIESSLAQFRPQLLSSLIQQQFQNLGSLSGMGENAAAGTGNAAISTGNNVANLLGQQGAAQAGGILGQAKADQAGLNNIGNSFTNGLILNKYLGGF